MPFGRRTLAGAALGLTIVLTTGCPAPPRICTACTYKTATFTSYPTSGVTSALLTATVKHSGYCPQRSGAPTGCTETLTYSVACNTSGTFTAPVLIDGDPTKSTRSAKILVKRTGLPDLPLTGTMETGTGTPTLPTTLCPPPAIDPYVTLPNVN